MLRRNQSHSSVRLSCGRKIDADISSCCTVFVLQILATLSWKTRKPRRNLTFLWKGSYRPTSNYMLAERYSFYRSTDIYFVMFPALKNIHKTSSSIVYPKGAGCWMVFCETSHQGWREYRANGPRKFFEVPENISPRKKKKDYCKNLVKGEIRRKSSNQKVTS